MRIGLLTGGGDCPGLNAVIRAAVRAGVHEHGDEFVGYRHGWRGVTRARKVRTTIPDPSATRAPDLVNRQFAVEAPNRLLVADFTYVRLAGSANTRSPTPRS